MITKVKPKGKSVKPKTKSAKKPKNKTVATLSPANDKEWQIRDDARTLKDAMAIKSDPSRLKAAQDYCSKEMETMKQIQKMK